ncbi:MAG TPA: M17 family peptidase N-terminal domain-containing protein [Myxococcaceae bacterium]|nr:M17 family peptidase N-terminal domain-containing protein [Myxococcaceae bacterium]
MSAAVSTVPLTLDALDPLPVDTLCLFVPEDERPLAGAAGYVDWRLCGQLSRLLVDGFFKGARGESLLLPSNGRIGPARVVVLGLGPGGEALHPGVLRSALSQAADVLNRARVDSVALELPGRGAMPTPDRTAAFDEAFVPAFRGARVTLLADGPARPSR